MRRFVVVWFVMLTCVVSTAVARAQVEEDWSLIYASPSDGDDEPTGFGLDDAGNCYVIGYGLDSTTDLDCFVAKYNSGSVLWERRFDGIGDTSDFAIGGTVSSDGSAFLTGYSRFKVTGEERFLTVKFTPDGDTAWARTYEIGNDIGRFVKPTADGGCIVSGDGGLPRSIALLKFDADGDSLWLRTLLPGGASFAQGNMFDCDTAGNIYVAAVTNANSQFDVILAKFSPDGDTLWTRPYDGGDYDYIPLVCVTPDGESYFCCRTRINQGDDVRIVKYDSEGDVLWERWYVGMGFSDAPVDCQLDGDGNLLVAVNSTGMNTNVDYVVLKYSPSGDTLFQSRIAADGSVAEYIKDMDIDSAGNVYLTGYRTDFGPTGQDYLSMKVDAATGDKVWDEIYDEGNDYNQGRLIAVGSEDEVYVVGVSNTVGLPETGKDIRTIKYKPMPSAVFESHSNGLPRAFDLHQNYPNPFNAGTTISFDMSESGRVDLEIFNTIGERVFEHAEVGLAPGSYTFEWDGTDHHGHRVASGIYLYRLTTAHAHQTRKMTLLK